MRSDAEIGFPGQQHMGFVGENFIEVNEIYSCHGTMELLNEEIYINVHAYIYICFIVQRSPCYFTGPCVNLTQV